MKILMEAQIVYSKEYVRNCDVCSWWVSKADLVKRPGGTFQAEKEHMVWDEWSMVLRRAVPGGECGRMGRGWEGRALNRILSSLCFFLMQVNSKILLKVFESFSVITKAAIYNSSRMVWSMIGRGEPPARRLGWRLWWPDET